MKMHRSSRAALTVLLTFILPVQGLPAQDFTDPDLLVYEGFDYATGGSLELLDGGKGWKTEWLWRNNFAHGGVQVFKSAQIERGSLGYGDLAVSGNHVRLTGVNGQLELGRATLSVAGTAVSST